jgi:hypothetical protein
MGIWRKSTYSDANGGNCVETASADSVVLVRDTTNRDGGTLALSADAWMVFTSKIKSVLRGSSPGRPERPEGLVVDYDGEFPRQDPSPAAECPVQRECEAARNIGS